MTYKLSLSKVTLKFLEDLPPKQFRQIINKVFALLSDPSPHDSKKLIGFDDYLRVDSGEYRIIYWTAKDTVTIDLIGKRNDDEVYKQLKRQAG
jgi:mRNA interferase RelE/StbE